VQRLNGVSWKNIGNERPVYNNKNIIETRPNYINIYLAIQ